MNETIAGGNRLLSMHDCANVLGIRGVDTVRRTRRRLRAIADQRGDLAFVTIAKAHYVTEADLRRILPELWAGEDNDADALRSLVQTLGVEVRRLNARCEKLENEAWSRNHAVKAAA